jgi:hypothetical protein
MREAGLSVVRRAGDGCDGCSLAAGRAYLYNNKSARLIPSDHLTIHNKHTTNTKMTVDQPISYPVTDDPQKALMRQYDPSKVLDHPDFKVLTQEEVDEYVKKGDKQVNLACAYNAKKEVHMVRKPDVKPGKGEVLIHVRATGICG